MPFLLTYTPEAKQRIQKLHPVLKRDIRNALEELPDNPWLGKKLQRELYGMLALRVRTYRILYWVNEEKKTIEVLTLGPRKSIYDDFTSKFR